MYKVCSTNFCIMTIKSLLEHFNRSTVALSLLVTSRFYIILFVGYYHYYYCLPCHIVWTLKAKANIFHLMDYPYAFHSKTKHKHSQLTLSARINFLCRIPLRKHHNSQSELPFIHLIFLEQSACFQRNNVGRTVCSLFLHEGG